MDGLELIGCILAALSIFTASTYVLVELIEELTYRADRRHREQEKKEAEKWESKR